MKISIDTNIFLDLILQRDNFKEPLRILNGYVADIIFLNIDYIASKQTKKIKDFLKVMNETFNIVAPNNQIFEKALTLDNSDLEDNIQYLCALANEC